MLGYLETKMRPGLLLCLQYLAFVTHARVYLRGALPSRPQSPESVSPPAASTAASSSPPPAAYLLKCNPSYGSPGIDAFTSSPLAAESVVVLASGPACPLSFQQPAHWVPAREPITRTAAIAQLSCHSTTELRPLRASSLVVVFAT